MNTIKVFVRVSMQARITHATAKVNNIPHFDVQRQLSQEEEDHWLKANLSLAKSIGNRHLLTLVKWNYEDCERLLETIFKVHVNREFDYFKERPPLLTMNLSVLNFLSSMRTFLDHSETYIKRTYGENSEIFRGFDQACHEEYDNNFAYRFLYGLRNYAQHCELPVDNISLQSKANKSDMSQPVYSMLVGMNRDRLLSDKSEWKPQVISDIESQADFIEIKPVMSIMMDCLTRLQKKIVMLEMPNLHGSATYMRNLIESLPRAEGKLYICDIPTDENGKRDYGKMTEMVTHEIPENIIHVLLNNDLEGFLRLTEINS